MPTKLIPNLCHSTTTLSASSTTFTISVTFYDTVGETLSLSNRFPSRQSFSCFFNQSSNQRCLGNIAIRISELFNLFLFNQASILLLASASILDIRVSGESSLLWKSRPWQDSTIRSGEENIARQKNYLFDAEFLFSGSEFQWDRVRFVRYAN